MNSSDSWSFFDKIYCISIDERPDRRHKARQQFAAVGLSELVEFIIVEKHPVSPEEGCYQSHIACLKKALASEARHILIFEDDIIFKHFMPTKIKEAADFLTKNPQWDIMFLGSIVRGSRGTASKTVRRIKYRCLSHAYAINRPFAAALVSRPWQGVPYDTFLARMNRKFYALYPACAFQSNAATDNKFFIDKLRRILGGLAFIQKANEIFHRHKLLIVISHTAVLAALFLFIFR
ncbi:glycosyltransferase family 25 protein [Desulfobacterota bacterium M19]